MKFNEVLWTLYALTLALLIAAGLLLTWPWRHRSEAANEARTRAYYDGRDGFS